MRSPRLSPSPSYAQARGHRMWLVFFALPVLTFLALALRNQEFHSQVGMTLVSVGILILLSAFTVPSGGAKSGAVKLRSSRFLTFAAPNILPTVVVAMTCVTVAGGVMVFGSPLEVGQITRQSGSGRYSDVGLLVSGLIGLGATVPFLFRPSTSGVALTDEGVVAESNAVRSVHVPWNQLREVELSARGRAKIIRLHDTHGHTHVLGVGVLASDPLVVAEAIAYFRDHSEHRSCLGGNPLEALALVVDVVALPRTPMQS